MFGRDRAFEIYRELMPQEVEARRRGPEYRGPPRRRNQIHNGSGWIRAGPQVPNCTPKNQCETQAGYTSPGPDNL